MEVSFDAVDAVFWLEQSYATSRSSTSTSSVIFRRRCLYLEIECGGQGAEGTTQVLA